MLSIIMLSVIMLSVIMLIVIMLSAVMLCVVALFPAKHSNLYYSCVSSKENKVPRT
jgi:hypothetical protein